MGDILITGNGFTVKAWRNGEIVPSEGFGGHEVTNRPKKIGITDWAGRPPFKVQLPIILSDRGASVLAARQTLEQAAIGANNRRPDAVQVHRDPGAGGGSGTLGDLPPGSGAEGWFIEDIDLSGRAKRRPDRTLVLKEIVLTLLEKQAGDTVREPTLSATVAGKAVATHYIVKKGDTLPSIAARELGDSTRWGDIAVLNGLRSSGQLKPGMTLKMP
jgi:nucleoid-associated protein YgaU